MPNYIKRKRNNGEEDDQEVQEDQEEAAGLTGVTNQHQKNFGITFQEDVPDINDLSFSEIISDKVQPKSSCAVELNTSNVLDDCTSPYVTSNLQPQTPIQSNESDANATQSTILPNQLNVVEAHTPHYVSSNLQPQTPIQSIASDANAMEFIHLTPNSVQTNALSAPVRNTPETSEQTVALLILICWRNLSKILVLR